MNNKIIETNVDKLFPKYKKSLLNLQKNTLINILTNILCSLSLVSFTMAMTVAKSRFDLIMSIFISFGVGIYLFIYKNFFISILTSSSADSVFFGSIFGIFSIFNITTWFTSSTSLGQDIINYAPIYRYLIYIGFSFCVFIFMSYFSSKIIEFCKDFYKTLSKNEKLFAIFSFIVLTAAISIIYSLTTGFWGSFDKVYSIDAGYVTKHIIPNMHYNDVRHPALNILFFPFNAISHIFEFIFKIDHIKYIILAILNSYLLVIVGLILKKVTNNKYVLYIYCLSFPTLIFSLFIEKYNIAVLLFALILYILYLNKSDLSLNNITVLSIGVMSSTVLLSPVMVYKKGDKFANNIKRLIIAGISTIIFLALIGKLNIIVNLISYLKGTAGFTHQAMPILERFYSFTNFLASCFIPLGYVVNDKGVFTWLNVHQSINILGVIILIVCILGFIKNKDKQPYVVMLSGLIMAFILFVFISWSPDESPLFGIYFSWAVIPLFVSGISFFFEENKIRYKAFISLILSIIFILNLEHAVKLISYMIANFKI